MMEINCKGSYTLGTSCGNCEKCERERSEISNMIQENIDLRQKNNALKEYYPHEDEELDIAINFINEINKIQKLAIIENNVIGYVTKINMNHILSWQEDEVEIIDFSGDIPKKFTATGWEDIENFD